MSAAAVKLERVSKIYKLYDSPKDRLKEALDPFRRRRHRDFFALNRIDLEINKGEILGVVGRNGSGKSTLLKLIAGVIPPSSGRLTINGNVSAMLELGSGLNPGLDGIQNIYFGGLMLGFSQEEMKAKMDDIIAFADIGDFIRQPLRTYSSGMKVRLGFALAVNVNPQILILDEVMAVGDDLFKRKCYVRMEALFKNNCSVIYVSHRLQSINEICTRAILLEKGECLLDGPPKLVTAQYERLLFSEPDRVAGIKEEILLGNRDAEWKRRFTADLPPNEARILPAASEARTEAQPAAPVASRPLYIPGLRPQSTILCRTAEVDIDEIDMHTPAGEKANVLEMNREYIYSFRVRFGAPAENVFFFMVIKTEKGIELTWNFTPKSDPRLRRVEAGDAYRVQWRFCCKLLAGSYYTTIGVHGTRDGKIVLLNRIVDASVFKVLKASGYPGRGYFHLDQTSSVSKLPPCHG